MSEDRRGTLEAILNERLSPVEQRIEQVAKDSAEIKALLQKIEAQQEQILRLLEKK